MQSEERSRRRRWILNVYFTLGREPIWIFQSAEQDVDLIEPAVADIEGAWGDLFEEIALMGQAWNCSGGKFEKFTKKCSGRILCSTILTINIVLSKIRKLPTTTVLKSVSGHNFQACHGFWIWVMMPWNRNNPSTIEKALLFMDLCPQCNK